MAHLKFSMIAALILLAALCSGAAAQYSDDDCTDVVITMSPCLIYGNSSAAPSAACCTQLATVARSQPQCLCQVIEGGASSLGLNVDRSQALALPKACNVEADASKCKGGGKSSNGASDAISSRLTLIFVIFCLFLLQLPFF